MCFRTPQPDGEHSSVAGLYVTGKAGEDTSVVCIPVGVVTGGATEGRAGGVPFALILVQNAHLSSSEAQVRAAEH
eukprot:13172685-Alexandrium_andersonii.AAC.1